MIRARPRHQRSIDAVHALKLLEENPARLPAAPGAD